VPFRTPEDVDGGGAGRGDHLLEPLPRLCDLAVDAAEVLKELLGKLDTSGSDGIVGLDASKQLKRCTCIDLVGNAAGDEVAPGERLCRQRGRLTPRYTGSSAKPLPDLTEGYDQDEVATHGAETANEDPKDSLTNKEDSIGRARDRQDDAGRASPNGAAEPALGDGPRCAKAHP
jgi:hypothetical protein